VFTTVRKIDLSQSLANTASKKVKFLEKFTKILAVSCKKKTKCAATSQRLWILGKSKGTRDTKNRGIARNAGYKGTREKQTTADSTSHAEKGDKKRPFSAGNAVAARSPAA